MNSADILSSIAAAMLVIWLCGIFVRRQLYRQFPFFFAYIVCSVLSTVARLSVSGNYRPFFEVYWTTEGLYAVLALLALHEVFRRVFLAFYLLWWWFRLIFPGAVVIVALITFSHTIQPPAAAPRVLGVILLASLVAKYVEAGLFGVFFALVVVCNLTWRTYAFGIVQGFAVSALGTWFASRGRSEFGITFGSLAKYGPAVAYILAVIVWLASFWRPEKPAAAVRWSLTVTPDEMAMEIKQYTELLWRFVRRR
jgi:hypothetical protein